MQKGSTPAAHWYTTITAVHKSGAQHIHDTETFGLPEHQVASTMISVLILSSSRHFNISVLGVVVKGAKNSMLMLRQNKP